MRKSLWSPDEDEKLRRYVATHGCGNWSDVAKHTGLHRCGKSCRLRWINYLRPDLKRGPFSAHEVRMVVNLHNTMGNSWSKIATQLPGRTDNDVKNFWHSYTRSRRVQQQQHTNNGCQNSSGASNNSNDQKACSSHEQYQISDMHKSKNEQGHMHNKSYNYEDLLQLHPLSLPSNTTNINMKGLAANGIMNACTSVNNAPQVHFSTCKPNEPYTTLNALSHTSLSSISFDQPTHNNVAHSNDPHAHMLLTQEASIKNPLINLDTKPHSDEVAALPVFYKGFHPQIFSDQCCSKVSSLSFQHFPPLKEVAPDHTNMINALPSSHANEIDCTVKLKSAVNNSNSRTSHLIPHEKSPLPQALLGDFPAASFQSAASLPATYAANKDEAADIKPPEGLQSVIWSFLKGQPEASASADALDDYNEAHYITSNPHYHHHNHTIKPPLALPNYLSSDHPPHQQLHSDQYINTEALSYTSPSNLQCLQAHYLADCFS